MDLVSHSLLGAVAGYSALARTKLGRKALLLGAAGGVTPDLDFFLRPFADPALPGELHRHFTHSLVFVPVGGLIALLPFLLSKPIRREWKLAYAATTLGCLTHGFLDAATSYGVRWLWPFSDMRVAWDIVAVIDPVFTVMLLLGVAVAIVAASRRPAAIAFVAALLYLGLGLVQNERGLRVQQQLAQARGHTHVRGRVMPTLFNLVLWRSVYEHDGVIYCDALRLPAGRARVRAGDAVPKYTPEDLPAGVPPRVLDIVQRFRHFADGYVAAVSHDPIVLGDLRYAAFADRAHPLWGLTLTPGNPHPEHMTVQWSTFFEARREALDALWTSIWSDDGFETISATPSARSASPARATARD